MRDYIDLGPVPHDETPMQIGSKEYSSSKALKECQRYVELLKKKFGEPPDGAGFKIECNDHDFGVYYSVVCYFDDKKQESIEYAFKCDNEAPSNWE